jgi:DNA-3-methyladenine glycosylase II
MPAMTDEEIIANLTQVRGIGVWTAQMFLMFSLNRPDVFPVGDLAIQRGMRELYRLKSQVGVSRLEKIAESWRPFRTVACWYIWEVSDQKS